MKQLRKLLFPFSALYYTGVWIRNKLYDRGVFRSQEYEFPLICVGNLSTGGTGKTPMTEFLIRLLRDRTQLGVLSRGYGRKTKGYIKLENTHTAIEVGDEPLQYATKYNDLQVAVCEDRSLGISLLKAEKISPEVILLDDAFQHRKVTPRFSILLTSYSELFYEDYVLPAGNLRDLRNQAKRAQAIVVTKCPANITKEERTAIRSKISKYADSTVYFAGIGYDNTVYGELDNIPLSGLASQQITLVTGIANPVPLLSFLKDKKISYTHRRYRDHHNFTSKDIATLDKCSCILTTEKDFMRLRSRLTHSNVFFLPMELIFLGEDSGAFTKRILEVIRA